MKGRDLDGLVGTACVSGGAICKVTLEDSRALEAIGQSKHCED